MSVVVSLISNKLVTQTFDDINIRDVAQCPFRCLIRTAPHLHPAEPHADGGRRALLTLADLVGLLLLGGVVAVLPGPHLQVQHAGRGIAPRQVLQQDEL